LIFRFFLYDFRNSRAINSFRSNSLSPSNSIGSPLLVEFSSRFDDHPGRETEAPYCASLIFLAQFGIVLCSPRITPPTGTQPIASNSLSSPFVQQYRFRCRIYETARARRSKSVLPPQQGLLGFPFQQTLRPWQHLPVRFTFVEVRVTFRTHANWCP